MHDLRDDPNVSERESTANPWWDKLGPGRLPATPENAAKWDQWHKEHPRDPNAHAVDERTRYNLPAVTTVTTPTATVPAHVLTPAQLRTVPMPNLRSGTARELDAAVRELDIPRDCTTWTERTDKRLANIEAAIERIADKVTVLRMERDR